jgi:DNA-directed RNA polymerase specialized sigma24 family protein
MWEDRLLLFRLKQGSAEAMQRIYETYKNDMLALAVSLVHDRPLAEDALHDVFVALTKYASSINLRTNLRNYLSCCIANRVRSL